MGPTAEQRPLRASICQKSIIALIANDIIIVFNNFRNRRVCSIALIILTHLFIEDLCRCVDERLASNQTWARDRLVCSAKLGF